MSIGAKPVRKIHRSTPFFFLLMVFRRATGEKTASQCATPGLRPSVFNRCSLISSGLDSLDTALGGNVKTLFFIYFLGLLTIVVRRAGLGESCLHF